MRRIVLWSEKKGPCHPPSRGGSGKPDEFLPYAPWILGARPAIALPIPVGDRALITTESEVLGPLKHLPPVPVRLAPGRRFDLDPAGVLAGAIRLIGELRDDAFETSAGCGGEQVMRVLKFFGITQPLVVGLGEEMAQLDSAVRAADVIGDPCPQVPSDQSTRRTARAWHPT